MRVYKRARESINELVVVYRSDRASLKRSSIRDLVRAFMESHENLTDSS